MQRRRIEHNLGRERPHIFLRANQSRDRPKYRRAARTNRLSAAMVLSSKEARRRHRPRQLSTPRPRSNRAHRQTWFDGQFSALYPVPWTALTVPSELTSNPDAADSFDASGAAYSHGDIFHPTFLMRHFQATSLGASTNA